MGLKQKQRKVASCGVVRKDRNDVLIVKLCYGFSWLLCVTEQNTFHQRCSQLVGLGNVFLIYVFIRKMCAWISLLYQICCQYVILKDLVCNVGIVYLLFVTGMFAVIFISSSKDCVCVSEEYEYGSQNS